ncbi:MAG: Mycothiol S-conjugate amidase [Acidimicrobiales bacterium]|nr:MAG: mycothiol conjugate amidase Mca [Actinomycetota bacterium]MBV6508291.1 Mycothiol S-conjugate amidase [Acidimicrobiales bacterium]RIK07075.1 MAG: mycothiol conjugate amidase Mca [Acidobacteriota bacterium]
MNEPLRLLCVHAHPDDEASKGAPTVAKYADEGIPATLVCCTGGEAGSILNPKMDRPDVRDNLHRVRMEELAKSTALIGYERVDLLGYRDSGMPDTAENEHPDNFANAPLDEAVERLVRIIRRDRPQVIITYPDDQRGYQHPDHLKVHDVSVPAFTRAGDPSWYPEAGELWAPLKLYFSVWSRRRMLATHHKMLELGLESPFDERWFEHPDQDHRITTHIDIGDYFEVRLDALLAHATQVDPDSPFWFGVPREFGREVHPYDDYILAESRVSTELPETDLFAGVPGR